MKNKTKLQKILNYEIVIQAKSQSSRRNFYKSEIENKTKFQKILKYRIAIHAKSQSSSKNFYKSHGSLLSFVWWLYWLINGNKWENEAPEVRHHWQNYTTSRSSCAAVDILLSKVIS